MDLKVPTRAEREERRARPPGYREYLTGVKDERLRSMWEFRGLTFCEYCRSSTFADWLDLVYDDHRERSIDFLPGQSKIDDVTRLWLVCRSCRRQLKRYPIWTRPRVVLKATRPPHPNI